MKTLVENNLNSKEIRDLIQNDIESSIFIDAGAGAGKTTSIVGRVLNQIKNGIEPKRIVIITFTNKATEEILSRINDRVYKAAREEKDLKTKELLTNAFNNLGSMTISTIHSFCYTLLSERSLNINLPIGVELMEDDELFEQQDKLFNKWMKSLKKEDYDILAKDGIIEYSLVSKMKDYFKDQFVKMEDSAYEIEEVDEYKFKNIPIIFLNHIEELDKLANDFASICGKNYDDVIKADGKRLLALKNDLEEFDESDIKEFLDGKLNKEKIELISNAFSYSKNALLTTKMRKEDIKSALNEFNAILEESIKKIDEIRKYFNVSKEIINDRLAIEYAYKAYLFYKENRSRIKISKDELLYLTNEIIKDDNARAYFASKYDCIYVDEFQDTDHIQADFIWRLTKEIDNYHKKNNIKCGSLVVVGDPKQSIYRFRGADPEVFFKIKEDYKEKESVVYSLNFNFRSNNLILDYVNREFEDKDIQGSNLSYNKMLYTDNHKVIKSINDRCIAGVFYYDIDSIKSEEDNIASLIKKLVIDKYLITKFNRDLKSYEWKEINYSDFMVLFNNFSNSNRFIEAFKKYDIPVSVSGRVDFKNEHGLKVFRRLFRGIVTPNDKIAKMGAIEALRMNNYNKDFKDEDEAFSFYNDIYSSILNDTKDLSGYGKALYLKEHLEYILGDRDLYNSIYVKITQAIENSFSKSISNAISLADYFDKYFESEIGEELMLDENISSVRFMNTHKSKGLEGNIVIWVNNCKDCTPKDTILKDKNVYHFGIKLNEKLNSIANKETERENGRLEYVAATRAMNVLIFSSAIKEETLFRRTGYNYHFDDLKDFQVGILPTELLEPEIKEEKEEYIPYENKLDQEFDLDIIHTSPSKYEIHEKRDKTANFNNLRPFGNVLGTIMHRALELLVLKRLNDNFDGINDTVIENIAKTTIYESANDVDFDKDYNKINKFVISVLKATLKLYKNLNIFNDAIIVEPEFTYSLFDKNLEKEFKLNDYSKIYLNGTMDLFIKYKDSILIIDYKSDFIGYQNDEQFAEILKNEYQNQLNVYKKSASLMFNDVKNIKTQIIYFKDYDYDNLNIIPVVVNLN